RRLRDHRPGRGAVRPRLGRPAVPHLQAVRAVPRPHRRRAAQAARQERRGARPFPETRTMIEAVILDLGNVLAFHDNALLFRELAALYRTTDARLRERLE